jgi:hypothetical protein
MRLRAAGRAGFPWVCAHVGAAPAFALVRAGVLGGGQMQVCTWCSRICPTATRKPPSDCHSSRTGKRAPMGEFSSPVGQSGGRPCLTGERPAQA